MRVAILAMVGLLAGCANQPGHYIPPPPPAYQTPFYPMQVNRQAAPPPPVMPAAQPYPNATLVGQRVGQTVTGQSAVICTFQVNGQHFDKLYPLGSSCPLGLAVQ